MDRAYTLIAESVKHKTTAALGAAVVIVPFFANASQISDILTNTRTLLNIVLQIVMTLAFVVFIWGIVKFIAAAGNPQQIKQAKGVMLYGILGIAVMAMITGIIAFLQSYFGIETGVPIKVPQFPP